MLLSKWKKTVRQLIIFPRLLLYHRWTLRLRAPFQDVTWNVHKFPGSSQRQVTGLLVQEWTSECWRFWLFHKRFTHAPFICKKTPERLQQVKEAVVPTRVRKITSTVALLKEYSFTWSVPIVLQAYRTLFVWSIWQGEKNTSSSEKQHHVSGSSSQKKVTDLKVRNECRSRFSINLQQGFPPGGGHISEIAFWSSLRLCLSVADTLPLRFIHTCLRWNFHYLLDHISSAFTWPQGCC